MTGVLPLLIKAASRNYHFIKFEIVVTAAGSSGKITGRLLVRAVRSPVRRHITLTGQPQAL